MKHPGGLVQGLGGPVAIAPGAELGLPAEHIGGRVFKAWPWDSDGIGDTMVDFARARPDLFPGIAQPLQRERMQTADPWNPEAGGPMVNTYGRAADAILKGYRVERRGAPGKDGRVDVVVSEASGAIVYTGSPYNYDPAATNLRDTVAFVGGALAGYAAVAALGGAAAGSAAAGSAAGGQAAAASSIEAAFAEAVAASGTLAPEGVAALIPSGAALGGAGALTGGALTLGAAGVAAGGAAAGASSLSSAVDAAVESIKAAAVKAAQSIASAKLVQAVAGGQVAPNVARPAPVAYPSQGVGATSPAFVMAAGALLVAAVVL